MDARRGLRYLLEAERIYLLLEVGMSTSPDTILYVLSDLAKRLDEALSELAYIRGALPEAEHKKEWLTLKEAHTLKGGCAYATLSHRLFLQPNGGVAEGQIGGVRVWRRETILEWAEVPDSEMEEYLRKKAREKLKRERDDIGPGPGPSYVRSS